MQIASTPSWRHLWYWPRENPYPLTPDIAGCSLISERLRLLCVYPAEGALISGQITSMAQSNSSRLGFLALITTLCRSKGVASDSLVFKHLSPIINLAYIRKNCWNPADLTVTIRGARRARARPTEAPSTSAAPPPARTLATPSTPSSTEFQCLEAMLRNIHQGQFNEWVAWPGTQPPLHREDEGLTAQREDESSETSTPEPLIRRKGVVETQEAAATSEKSLEATSEPSEPAANPSTPEDQTTPVLSPNTSSPATPVLRLIDEEDVQTPDTQDRSQDF
ncbi:hypothetical protein GmHk_11G032588 [Glycine max]|nr:hypothetical protein GmHk_11G032588 [Glycine max]